MESKDGDWYELAEKAKWPVALVLVAVFVHMRLMLFAVAVPLLVYWHTVKHQDASEDSAQQAGGGDEIEDDDDAADAGFDGRFQRPGCGSGVAGGSQFDGDEDPYGSDFWGQAIDGGARSSGGGAARAAASPKLQSRYPDDLMGRGAGPVLQDDLDDDMGLGLRGPGRSFGGSGLPEGGGPGLGDDLGDDLGLGLGGAGRSLGGGRPPAGGGFGRVGDLGSACGDDALDLLGDFGGFGDDGLDFIGGGCGSGRGKGKSKGKGKDGKGKDSKGGKDGKDFVPRPPDPKQVFVGGIGDTDDDEIRSFFASVGEIDRLKVLTQPDGTPKGACFVTFRTEEQAQDALGLHGTDLLGRRVSVRPAHGGQGKDGGKDASKGGKDSAKGAKDFGKDRAPRDPWEPREPPPSRGPRMEIDDLLEEALEEESGPLRPEDFDIGSKRFLTELMAMDRQNGTRRSVDALEMVFKQTRSKARDSVRKWPAYIFTLLQKFDPELFDELAARRLEERDAERRAGRRGDVTGREKGSVDAPRLGDVQQAWKDCPDQGAEGGRQVLDRWGKPVLI